MGKVTHVVEVSTEVSSAPVKPRIPPWVLITGTIVCGIILTTLELTK